MKLNGTFTVAASAARVYQVLTDPNQLIPTLPDIEGYTVESEDAFTVNVKVGVSFIRGTMRVAMNIVEKVPDTRAAYKGKASGLGSSAELLASFNLAERDAQTEVAWEGEAKVGGRLVSAAGGMLEPIARKNIEKFVQSLQAALDASSVSS